MTHQLLQFLGGYYTLVFRGKRSPQIVKAIYMAIVRVFVLLMTFQVDPCGLLNPQELRSQPAWVVEPREDDRLETLDLVQMLYNCRVQRNALVTSAFVVAVASDRCPSVKIHVAPS